MPLSLAVDVAHWPWPLGWSWNNGVVGNLVASAVWIAGAAVLTAVLWPPARRAIHRFVDRKLTDHRAHQQEHEAWVARHIAELYRKGTGAEPEPHPHGHELSSRPDPPKG